MEARRTTVIVLGHGSRNSDANHAFEACVAAFAERRSGERVVPAYVELAAPSLSAALSDAAACSDRVIVLPLFLFAAGHVKNDVPIALENARRAFPHVEFVAGRAIGVDPNLVDLVYERARAAMTRTRGDVQKTALVVVGRGSSDPDANGDFCKVVRLLGEGRSFGWALPCFLGVTTPSVEETLELVARIRPEQLVVVPYLLFGGRLTDRLADRVTAFGRAHPWIPASIADVLGMSPTLLDVLAARLDEIEAGRGALPCDTCQYRRPIGDIAQIGGMRALLYSVRHSLTHAQAAPHVHAHRSLKKHVLVCGNADCADRGSIPLITALRRQVKEAGRQRDIRITRTACLGRCGEGPTVSVYPDGVWYRGVGEEDAPELVTEHLLGDRIVARLVDDIMQ